MCMFSQDDARWLKASVEAIYSAADPRDLALAVMTAANRRFGLLATYCEKVGAGLSSHTALALECKVPPPPDFAAYIHDYPLRWIVGSAQAPRVVHLRAMVPMSQWTQSEHFNGIARPMGWNDQILIVAENRWSCTSVGLLRDVAFSTPSARSRNTCNLMWRRHGAGWPKRRFPTVQPGHFPSRLPM